MSVVADPNAAVNDLADRFWEGILERDPTWATLLGDERYNDRWPDLGPDGRAADEAAYRSALAEASAIPAEGLEPEQVITRDLVVLVSQNQLEALAQKQYQLALDHMSGPQVWPAEMAQYQAAEAPEQLDKLLARYTSYPALIEQYIETLSEGVDDGRTAATVPVRRAIEQIDRLLAMAPADNPAAAMARVGDESRPRVVEAVEEHVYAGLRRLRDYLAQDYEPHAREQPGLSATPGGDAAYRLAIRTQTSIDTTAEEVHAFGMADLDSIEAEMDEIAHRLGHADRRALRSALLEDASNHTSDPEALVRLAQDQTDRAYAAAPRYFGRIPSANCYVKAVEPYREAESPPAFYMPPTIDGSRQGQYYINTYQPEDRQLHRIAAITFHEATPGHHFQIGIEMELQGLPAFRTLGARMAGGAYVEGWGLYTERLADEMGLYADDRERMGMLEAQAFRAARLVVDSGLHAMGWSRQQAVDFMHERGSLPMVDAEIEVDRYTVWPAQALCYKVGQREIERARADVSSQMGSRFDLRAFHDEVLGHGSLPLATLRREIPGWVEAAVAAS
ncbi:MAG TPA: DUF885 domain-containing protein [Candidatus Limnocylindria bacterium]|nr:DUF885 domain-containing protein [Candidatus Limnocylindria bacterium]